MNNRYYNTFQEKSMNIEAPMKGNKKVDEEEFRKTAIYLNAFLEMEFMPKNREQILTELDFLANSIVIEKDNFVNYSLTSVAVCAIDAKSDTIGMIVKNEHNLQSIQIVNQGSYIRRQLSNNPINRRISQITSKN
jgi:hypothetical protein